MLTINDKKCEAINDRYLNKKYDNRLVLEVGNMSVYRKANKVQSFEVCRLENLSSLIKELQDIRHAIEEETGVRF